MLTIVVGVIAIVIIILSVTLFLVAEVVSGALLRQFCATDALFFDPFDDEGASDDNTELSLGGDGTRLERAVLRVVSAAVEAMDRPSSLRRPVWAAFDILSSAYLVIGHRLDALLRPVPERAKRETARRVLREMIQSHRY